MRDARCRVWTNGKLECRVEGKPYPKVKFFKDWHALTHTARMQLQQSDYNYWALSLDGVIMRDEGLYICVAQNLAGKAYCFANLKVEGEFFSFFTQM